MELRPEQRTTVDKAKEILKAKNVVYLAAEVRCGKTIMSIFLAKEMGYKRICFITKKKAIGSIVKDYQAIGNTYRVISEKKEGSAITLYRGSGNGFDRFLCTNFEQIKNIEEEFDVFIVDEAHACGQVPKPSQRATLIKELIGHKPVILMSGTPHPETPSQIFHQFWITQYGPFQEFKNFYKWSKEYVNVKQRKINGFLINDYSHAKEEKVKEAIHPYMVQLSQQEAGFISLVEEQILNVPIDNRMYKLMEVLKRDKIYTMKCGDVILADTPVKLQSLFHQLSSGTVNITEFIDGKEVRKKHILDESKAWFINSFFAGQKIAIFYKFIAEGDLLRRIFPNYTSNPEEFNAKSDIYFICQVISGREGVNLSSADALVMYNIDFSATSYFQARARIQTKDRVKASKLYWLFSEKGIEKEVYKAVSNKKSFTLQFFNKVYNVAKQISNGSRKQVAAKNYYRP